MLSSLPDLGKSFAAMKIADKLRDIPPVTLYGTIIHWALNNKPLSAVCKLIMDQYNEDPSDVLHVVGQETIDLIKQHSHQQKRPA